MLTFCYGFGGESHVSLSNIFLHLLSKNQQRRSTLPLTPNPNLPSSCSSMVGGTTRVSFLRTTPPFPMRFHSLFCHQSFGSMSFLGRDGWVGFIFFCLGGLWFCFGACSNFSDFDLFLIRLGGEGAWFRRREGALFLGALFVVFLFVVVCCFYLCCCCWCS